LAALAALGFFMTMPVLAQSAGQASTDWQFRLTPYAWVTGFTGEIRAGEAVESIGASFSNILDSLDFGLMGAFEARKGRWGFLFDGFYAKLSKDGSTSGAADISVHAKLIAQLYSLALSFRALPNLDILGGVRMMPVSASLGITSGVLDGRQASGSSTAVNGFVGARLALPLARRWTLDVYGDIGTGDSKLVWLAQAGLSLNLSRTLTAKLGYRYMSIENEASDVQVTMVMGGFYFGLGIRL
jgi:opacity protein-like surface antigen